MGLLVTLLWPSYDDLPWPVSYIPRICRLAAFIAIFPILVLIAIDMAAYLYFRIVQQPWFFGERTAYWTFPRPSWRSRGPTPASSPEIGRSTVLPDPSAIDAKLTQRTPKKAPPSEVSKGLPPLSEADVPDRTGSPRRTHSCPSAGRLARLTHAGIKMRHPSVGFEGPLLGLEPVRSPSPEDARSHEGSSDDSWIKPSEDQ